MKKSPPLTAPESPSESQPGRSVHRAAVSNVMPSNLTKGSSSGICSSMLFGSDWASSVMGTFGAVELLVDELTLATTGFNQLILNAFMDHTVRRASDFASMDDLLAG